MAISGAASPSGSFGRFQALMKDLHGAVEKRQGKNLTAPQADKIVTELEQLKGAEKLAAGEILKQFLKNDAFSVTDAARESFAKALGVDAASLKPQPSAGGVKRTIAKLGLELAAGATKMDGAKAKELFGALKKESKDVGDFVTQSVRKASQDGEVKLEPEARKELVKEVAQRNHSGAVENLANKFGDDFAKRVPPYLLEMMSSPPLFEELIFILMITLVSDTQKEVLEEQARIQKVVKDDQTVAAEKEAREKLINTGLSKKASAGPVAAGPDVDAAAMAAERHRLGHTQRKLEGFVQAVDASLRDDGRIDNKESKALVEKLERSFKPGHPARELLGEAIGSAITHSTNLRPEVKAAVQPFLDWAIQATGKTEFPKPTAAGSGEPLAEKLMGSDRIEQRLAGFLVDSFFKQNPRAAQAEGAEKQASAVERMKPLVQELVGENQPGQNAQAAPRDAAAVEGAQPKAEGGQVEARVLARFQRIVEANERIKAKSGGRKELDVEGGLQKAIEHVMPNATPEQKAGVSDAVKKAFAALPKDRPANDADVRKSYTTARDSLVATVVDNDPEVKAAAKELIDSSMTDAIRTANDKIKNLEDGGKKKLTKEQKGEILNVQVAVAREEVVQRCRDNGMSEEQAQAFGHVFDRQADALRNRFERTGKIEPENANGAGMESTDPTETNDTRSRQIMFEQLKFKMNMLSEMMQSMSNILNTMHQNAENTIRAIR
jgi:hypothetical protein